MTFPFDLSPPETDLRIRVIKNEEGKLTVVALLLGTGFMFFKRDVSDVGDAIRECADHAARHWLCPGS